MNEHCPSSAQGLVQSESRAALLDSLLLDYDADEGDYTFLCQLRAGAATRMLYYFPEETTALGVDPVGRLDVVLELGNSAAVSQPASAPGSEID
ncbi:MAG: hypothetical protein AMXMBFR13_23900 [Phycisphaerae bacterium]